MFKLRAWAKECIKNYTLRSDDEPTKNYIDLLIQRCRQSERRVEEFKKFYNEAEELLDKQIEATYNMYKENMELKEQVSSLSKALVLNTSDGDDERLAKAKEIMNIAIEGIKHWGIVNGDKRPFAKQAETLFNLFLNKAEQFMKEVKV